MDLKREQDLVSLVLCKLGECSNRISADKKISDPLSILLLPIGKGGCDETEEGQRDGEVREIMIRGTVTEMWWDD